MNAIVYDVYVPREDFRDKLVLLVDQKATSVGLKARNVAFALALELGEAVMELHWKVLVLKRRWRRRSNSRSCCHHRLSILSNNIMMISSAHGPFRTSVDGIGGFGVRWTGGAAKCELVVRCKYWGQTIPSWFTSLCIHL
jgi:hypothetical protein